MPRTRVGRIRAARFLAMLGSLLLAVAALAGCGGGQDDSAQRDVIDTLRIGVIGSTNTLTGPIGFAHSQGKLLEALKPLGVNKIEVYNFPNGPDLNQALIGGRLDVAQYGDTPALVARGSGLDTRLISISQFDLNAGVVAKDPNIKTLKDLAGKRIGVPKGSYIDRYLQGALQAEGVTAELVHLYPADQEAPLNSGEIAGAALPGVVPSVTLQTFLLKGFHLVDSVYENHPDLAGTSVTVAADVFLGKHPTFGAAWQKLHADSVTYTKANWNAYVDFEIANSKAPAEAIRQAANAAGFAPEPFPARGVDLLTGTKKFLADQGSLKEDFDLDSWYYRPDTSSDS
ncbi:ABC transporter substrate-binding protein [Gordonia sp. NPDC003376]